jgi:excisionase family DNA binding protein
MSDAADRVALEGLRLLIRQELRALLAEERPTSPAAVEGFIGCAEAARRAGVEAATVRGWVKAGVLAAVKPPGTRGWKIKPSDLDAFLARPSTGLEPVHSPPVDLAGERARRLAASIPRAPGKGGG